MNDGLFTGEMLGGHVRAVFTLITYIFIICVAYTVTSFKEIPLDLIENDDFLVSLAHFLYSQSILIYKIICLSYLVLYDLIKKNVDGVKCTQITYKYMCFITQAINIIISKGE